MATAGPSSLAILVDERRVNDLLAQKTGARAIFRSACNLLLFILFLLLYSVLSLAQPLPAKRAFEGFLRRQFDINATMPIANVTSIDDFWNYTSQTLMPALYGTDITKYYLPGVAVPTLLPMKGDNVLFGIGRLRMLKIKPNQGCIISSNLRPKFGTCYGDYTLQAEDRSAFGPVTASGQPAYSYTKDSSGPPYAGILTTYGTGGFMNVFSADYIKTQSSFAAMRNAGFIDISVRALFFEFTVYSFDLGLYACVNLAFEVAATGDWVQQLSVTILEQRDLSALGSGTTAEWLYLLGEALLVLFVLRYLLEEASEILGAPQPANDVIGCGGKFKIPVIRIEYFFDAWNIIDVGNLVLIIVALLFRMQAWSMASNLQVFLGNQSTADLTNFTNFWGVSQAARTANEINAFNMVLTWFKAVKYINIVPYITTFMQTVSMSQRRVISFIFQFVTAMVGFVLAFHLAFGEMLPQFRTFEEAAKFLMSTWLGNGDMGIVYNNSPFLGSLLVLMYISTIFFVYMNLFKGIILAALSDAKHLEDANSAKRWAQQVDRANNLWADGVAHFKLDSRVRAAFPGLYSRIASRRKRLEELQKLRDQAVLDRKHGSLPDDALALGPGSPSWGRRPKKNLATMSLEDAPDSDSEGSEVDLGPLRSQEQLKRTGALGNSKVGFGGTGGFSATGGSGYGHRKDEADTSEATPETIDLVIDATRHIASGIVERTRGARNVLFGEIAESKEVLKNIGVVMDVLGRRARDLEAQQRQLLKALR